MKLPPLKRFFESDKQSDLVYLLNNFLQVIWTAFDKNVTFQENIRSHIMDITYTGGSTINFANPLKTPILGVFVLQASGEGITGAPYAIWQQNGDFIAVSSITGLTSGNAYNLRIMFV